jgi:FHA domain
MDGDPLAVALKFGFLAVLYLFLFTVARSALKDLRGGGAPAPAADGGTGMHAVRGGRVAATDAWLVALSGAGLEIGDRFDLFGGITIGRGTEADLRIEDRFSSTIHCRVHSRGNTYLLEDMNSTNGTFLNGARLSGEAKLQDLDELSIGDTTFRFELSVPDPDGG